MPPMKPEGAHFGLILPLCTSSATVGLALFQYVFSCFDHPFQEQVSHIRHIIGTQSSSHFYQLAPQMPAALSRGTGAHT